MNSLSAATMYRYMQRLKLGKTIKIYCYIHCAEMLDALPRERKMTSADVTEEVRPKLEELFIEGMVVGADVDEMHTLIRLLLAHDQLRLVRLTPLLLVSFMYSLKLR